MSLTATRRRRRSPVVEAVLDAVTSASHAARFSPVEIQRRRRSARSWPEMFGSIQITSGIWRGKASRVL